MALGFPKRDSLSRRAHALSKLGEEIESRCSDLVNVLNTAEADATKTVSYSNLRLVWSSIDGWLTRLDELRTDTPLATEFAAQFGRDTGMVETARTELVNALQAVSNWCGDAFADPVTGAIVTERRANHALNTEVWLFMDTPGGQSFGTLRTLLQAVINAIESDF